jgi:hypothetical protein
LAFRTHVIDSDKTNIVRHSYATRTARVNNECF